MSGYRMFAGLGVVGALIMAPVAETRHPRETKPARPRDREPDRPGASDAG